MLKPWNSDAPAAAADDTAAVVHIMSPGRPVVSTSTLFGSNSIRGATPHGCFVPAERSGREYDHCLPAASEVVPAQPASSAQAARGAAPLQEEGREQREGKSKESSREELQSAGVEQRERGSRPALLPESR